MKIKYIIFKLSIFLAVVATSCKKLIQIDPPVNSITTTETFADSTNTNSAILGLYALIYNQSAGSMNWASGNMTWICGASADEIIPNNPGPFYLNSLNSTEGSTNSFWVNIYPCVYEANACIEGINASNGLSAGAKKQFIGEAEFLRAFCYFYLVNLYGDVPDITTTNFKSNALAPRASSAQIYQQITTDLINAQSSLKSGYSMSPGNLRTRANKEAATALLARVYLYLGQFQNAETQASSVINNSNYGLSNDLNTVFQTNSTEAILQWQTNTAFSPFNGTIEGYNNLPPDPTSSPQVFYLSNQLLSAFESGDQRMVAWVNNSNYSGTNYYYPFKYKIGPAQLTPNALATEYYTVFRLAEQYLIRAEARANLNENNAVDDLNIIRRRAGLPNYAGATDQASLLNAIAHENQIEFFAEWGHRWLDLKRTKQIDVVMSLVTPQKSGGAPWNSYQQLYPIPVSELSSDPNLKQNPGY